MKVEGDKVEISRRELEDLLVQVGNLAATGALIGIGVAVAKSEGPGQVIGTVMSSVNVLNKIVKQYDDRRSLEERALVLDLQRAGLQRAEPLRDKFTKEETARVAQLGKEGKCVHCGEVHEGEPHQPGETVVDTREIHGTPDRPAFPNMGGSGLLN